MWKRSNSGPNTVPWGTPDSTFTSPETEFSFPNYMHIPVGEEGSEPSVKWCSTPYASTVVCGVVCHGVHGQRPWRSRE